MPTLTSFVFVADLHLQPQTWMRHPDLREDAYVSMAVVRDYCRHNNIPLVLGGDIFNSRRPDPGSVQVFNRAVSLLGSVSGGAGSYYIQGNHDYCGRVPWPGVTDDCDHLRQQTRTINGLRVYGIDWMPRERLAEELAKIPADVYILVCHQAWEELQGIGNTDGSLAMIPSHIKVLFTGDYHVSRDYMYRREDGSELCVYSPGSTYMTKINESPDKFMLLVIYSDTGMTEYDQEGESFQRGVEIEVQRIKIPTRRMVTRTVKTCEDLEEVLHFNLVELLDGCVALDAKIRKPIVQVKFHDDIPGAYERLRAYFGCQTHFFPSPIHVTSEVIVDVDEDPDTFDTLAGAVRRLEDDPDIVDGVLRLLAAAGNPVEEIEIMAREYADEYVVERATSGEL